ncbi:MAG TPA: methyltransferase domain-containing protein [Burkholderiales bacterium]|nr:methyltransferase domain-containing protein [Burkholderiales bacterium]
MPDTAAPTDIDDWFATPLGQYLLEREYAYFDQAVADVFGYNAFQVGLPQLDLLRASRIPLRCRVAPKGPVDVRSDFGELPIATASTDLVLLPHVLEFAEHPHQILRDVARILMPEAHVIVSGFNPFSLWGMRRRLHRASDFPWRGRFISLMRVKDWLALLGFEVIGGQMACYAPPSRQQKWLERFSFMEAAGDRWWPISGGVYFLQAVKRVRGVRLIMPKWSDRLAPVKQLAASPHKIGEKEEALTVRARE